MRSTCETRPLPEDGRVFWLVSKRTTFHSLFTVITWGTWGKDKHSRALPGRIHFPNYWLESKPSLPNHYAHFLPKIELWPCLSLANNTELQLRWELDMHRRSVNRLSHYKLVRPYYHVLYAVAWLQPFAQAGGDERFFFLFCSDGGKWGQSVWGLFFWVSKELTVNSTQELPWQDWVLAAGCTWGVSLKNKTSIKQLKKTHVATLGGLTHYRVMYILLPSRVG